MYFSSDLKVGLIILKCWKDLNIIKEKIGNIVVSLCVCCIAFFPLIFSPILMYILSYYLLEHSDYVTVKAECCIMVLCILYALCLAEYFVKRRVFSKEVS